MCGRFLLATPVDAIVELFGIDRVLSAPVQPRYNIAPMQMVPIIRSVSEDAGRMREFTLVRWGLVPRWADDPTIGNRMINARCESVDTKPAFREAFEHRRCIAPADGFYEWKKIGRGKQPMAIVPRDGKPLAFAGLWERWRDRTKPDAPWLETCTILTCAPNELVRDVHDRMPVMLDRDAIGTWLEGAEPADLKSLLKPYPSDRLRMYPVSRQVGSPSFDEKACLDEVEEAQSDEGPGEVQGRLF